MFRPNRSPVQPGDPVLVSIVSLPDDAECSSPANVDAGVMLRKDPQGYKNRVKEDVEKSKEDIPAGFVMPTHESTSKKPEKIVDEPDFWVDSEGEEDDFGGSDTDQEMTEDGDDGLPDDEDQEDQEDEEGGDEDEEG